MNGSLDAVVHLDVKFWDLVVFVHASIHNITHGGSVDNVLDKETFDRLILGDHLTSGVTAHGGDVAAGACRTIASVISSFDSHGWVVVCTEVVITPILRMIEKLQNSNFLKLVAFKISLNLKCLH